MKVVQWQQASSKVEELGEGQLHDVKGGRRKVIADWASSLIQVRVGPRKYGDLL